MERLRVEGLLEVKACPHGRGVYASRNLLSGEMIWVFDDVSFTTTPASPPWKRWAIIVGKTEGGRNLFWDQAPEESPEYWSNFLDHAEHPNVRFEIEIGKPSAHLVTTMPIKTGDELLLNYKEYSLDNWAPD